LSNGTHNDNSNNSKNDRIQLIKGRIDGFFGREGRRPRVLVVRIDPDSSSRGMKAIAAALADVGFDVDLHMPLQTPRDAARIAIDNDVHMIVMAEKTSKNLRLVSELRNALKGEGRDDIQTVAWDSLSMRDYINIPDSKIKKRDFQENEMAKITAANRILDVLERNPSFQPGYPGNKQIPNTKIQINSKFQAPNSKT